MPAPTSYTENTLAEFMKASLANVATTLDWSITDVSDEECKYVEAVNDTILSYGQATIDLCSDMRKLRALALREVWKAVMQATAANYRFGSDREQYFRQQIHEQATAQYAIFATSASVYEPDDPRYNVTVISVLDKTDPYTYNNRPPYIGGE